MSLILGCDFSTKQVDLVLLDEDTFEPVWVPCPIKAADPFDAARNVYRAVRLPHIPWESVAIVGIENTFARSFKAVEGLARVQGAIIASLPVADSVPIFWTPAYEWKIQCLGRGHGQAKKEVVAAWAAAELADGGWPLAGWTQDALDAYCICRSTLRLAEAAVAWKAAVGHA